MKELFIEYYIYDDTKEIVPFMCPRIFINDDKYNICKINLQEVNSEK